MNAHMELCSPGCHFLSDGKFYYCGQIFAAENLGLVGLKENDYFDLGKKEMTSENKEKFLKYCLGISEGEFNSVCDVCYGSGIDNPRIVGVAEQI